MPGLETAGDGETLRGYSDSSVSAFAATSRISRRGAMADSNWISINYITRVAATW